jgi:hypothetical protein
MASPLNFWGADGHGRLLRVLEAGYPCEGSHLYAVDAAPTYEGGDGKVAVAFRYLARGELGGQSQFFHFDEGTALRDAFLSTGLQLSGGETEGLAFWALGTGVKLERREGSDVVETGAVYVVTGKPAATGVTDQEVGAGSPSPEPEAGVSGFPTYPFEGIASSGAGVTPPPAGRAKPVGRLQRITAPGAPRKAGRPARDFDTDEFASWLETMLPPPDVALARRDVTLGGQLLTDDWYLLPLLQARADMEALVGSTRSHDRDQAVNIRGYASARWYLTGPFLLGGRLQRIRNGSGWVDRARHVGPPFPALH